MSTLRELRDTLTQIAHPDRVLRLADKYLQDFTENREDFILPKEHVLVKPLLEFYVGDLDGWKKFVRIVRDRLPQGSDERRAVQELYKVLEVRAIQRRNRILIDAATDVAIRKGLLDPTWESKQRYAKRCIQAWKARKDNMLKTVRSQSPTGRVSADHREKLLKEYWTMVSEEVNNGEVPKP